MLFSSEKRTKYDVAPGPQPLKTYSVSRTDRWSARNRVVSNSTNSSSTPDSWGTPLLYVKAQSNMKLSWDMAIRRTSPDGPVIAAVKPMMMSRSLRLSLSASGAADQAPKERWVEVRNDSKWTSRSKFVVPVSGGRTLMWRRDPDRGFLSSCSSYADMLLLDVSRGEVGGEQVLAAYAENRRGFFDWKLLGTLDFFVDLGEDELPALAAILGIAESAKRARAAAASASASAGATGG